MFLQFSPLIILLLINLIPPGNVLAVGANNVGEPLFLTHYINSGQIQEARRLAEVHNVSSSVVSYSGLITVDQVNGAHTFFWFFPAARDPENAPVILWMEGGPGYSGLYSVFIEHGPFYVGVDGELHLRDTAWTNDYSVIYTDQPVDVGFSFTEQEAGYVTSGEGAAPNMYNFLTQFFIMFPEFKENDFYSSGVSFGGIYAPAVAHYIDARNRENPSDPINLRGLFLESPLSDPIRQMDYGEYLYHVGLVDESGRQQFQEKEEMIKNFISQGLYTEAEQVFGLLILGKAEYRTLYENVTGLGQYYNILFDQPDENDLNWVPLVQSEHFRRALHVGNLSYQLFSDVVKDLFRPNLLRSVKPLLEDLLNNGYKVLMVAGQFDVITHSIGIENVIRALEWRWAEEFRNAQRKIWRVDDALAGYVKTSNNFTQILLRNAGHDVVANQPVMSLDMLNRFVRNIPFSV